MTTRWIACVWGVAGSLVSAVSLAAPPAGKAELVLRSDATCALKQGARAAGTLKPGESRSLIVAPGVTELTCTSAEWPDAVARETVTLVTGASQQLLLRVRFARVDDTVQDRAQRLLWSRADNGTDVNWNEAQAWCQGKGAGWRLPTRSELEGLLAAAAGETTPCKDARCKVPALFTLSAYWMWSADRDATGKAAYLYLHTGHPQFSAPDYRLNARALCVRPA